MKTRDKHFMIGVIGAMVGVAIMYIGLHSVINKQRDALKECQKAQPENCERLLNECELEIEDYYNMSRDLVCLEVFADYDEILDSLNAELEVFKNRANRCEAKRCRCYAWGVGPTGKPHCRILNVEDNICDGKHRGSCCEEGLYDGYDVNWGTLVGAKYQEGK